MSENRITVKINSGRQINRTPGRSAGIDFSNIGAGARPDDAIQNERAKQARESIKRKMEQHFRQAPERSSQIGCTHQNIVNQSNVSSPNQIEIPTENVKAGEKFENSGQANLKEPMQQNSTGEQGVQNVGTRHVQFGNDQNNNTVINFSVYQLPGLTSYIRNIRQPSEILMNSLIRIKEILIRFPLLSGPEYDLTINSISQCLNRLLVVLPHYSEPITNLLHLYSLAFRLSYEAHKDIAPTMYFPWLLLRQKSTEFQLFGIAMLEDIIEIFRSPLKHVSKYENDKIALRFRDTTLSIIFMNVISIIVKRDPKTLLPSLKLLHSCFEFCKLSSNYYAIPKAIYMIYITTNYIEILFSILMESTDKEYPILVFTDFFKVRYNYFKDFDQYNNYLDKIATMLIQIMKVPISTPATFLQITKMLISYAPDSNHPFLHELSLFTLKAFSKPLHESLFLLLDFWKNLEGNEDYVANFFDEYSR